MVVGNSTIYFFNLYIPLNNYSIALAAAESLVFLDAVKNAVKKVALPSLISFILSM